MREALNVLYRTNIGENSRNSCLRLIGFVRVVGAFLQVSSPNVLNIPASPP
jgi:hypothetical protein